MKFCPCCKTDKEFKDFSKSSSKKDGLQSHCKVCRSKRRKKDYIKNKDRELELNAIWQRENPKSRTNSRRKYYKKYPEKVLERNSKWRRDNPDKVKLANKKAGKKWANANRGACNHKGARYRSARLNSTPNWLTEDQLQDIKSMYLLAKKFEILFGIKYHVDHIVPLQGKDICGLHVPWNLQLLEAGMNFSKSNKTKATTSLQFK